MTEVIRNLEGSWQRRKEEARKKVLEAVKELQQNSKPVNFNSVYVLSGVSKSFLYDDAESNKIIEECRKREADKTVMQHMKYDKTSRSKDVIIEAKDKRIAKLEDENRKLTKELEILRGLLYDKN